MKTAFQRAAATLCVSLILTACAAVTARVSGGVDRKPWVERNNPHLNAVDINSPFSVGNGGFAYTADVTGMQSYTDQYHEGIPTETMSDWGWNSMPNVEGYTLEDASRPYDTHGKTLLYPTNQGSPAGKYFRTNPHRIPLGQIGLDMTHADGTPVKLEEIKNIDQKLDMWSGTITSRFTIDGAPVSVRTSCAPDRDALAFHIDSPLLASGRIKAFVRFPYDHSIDDGAHKLRAPMIFDKPEGHQTDALNSADNKVMLKRTLIGATYYVGLAWTGAPKIGNPDAHRYVFDPAGDAAIDIVADFSSAPIATPTPSAGEVFAASAKHWPEYWARGGAIDFTRVADPRARELESRVVLSTYLLAIQYAGDKPDQETGLTSNSWHGKHHSEMYWWHTAHFPLWGRPDMLESTMDWYKNDLPVARKLAKYRGLKGARWAKMMGPDGIESPGGNPFILWNQPHVICLAELVYRDKPTQETLERWKDLVLDAADGMASYAYFDKEKQRYVLGPPLWISQEIYDQQKSQNPTYELEQWKDGLEIAQQWRERLGMSRSPEWQDVIDKLSPLPVKNGKYVAMESIPDSFDPEAETSREDHPSMLAALGVMPGTMVDRATMENTLDAVMKTWGFERKIWGWDFPMIAMTAARLNQPEVAVDALLMKNPSNLWRTNGHVKQMNDLPLYLPANGGFLEAIACMSAGWDGCTEKNPGFPKDWDVRWDGIKPLP